MNQLWHLAFVSRSACGGDPKLVDEWMWQIHDVSFRNNLRDGITGAKLWVGGYWCQTREGTEESLEAVFDRIQPDARHVAVKLLVHEPIEKRLFPNDPIKPL